MKSKTGSGIRRRVWGVAGIFMVGVLAAAAVGLMIYPYADMKMDASLMDIPKHYEPSVLYAYDPDQREARQGGLHPAEGGAVSTEKPRVYVTMEEIPKDLANAFVAIEDKRFYSHKGVDVLRTARAALGYVTGKTTFGASTITQQLVKNLTGNDEYSPERKCGEIFMALDLERQRNKEEILEVYLNIINLAEGCRGVGEAAERYYSKSVSELTLSQCATIAAITNNPARYDPLTHPENNLSRRNLILREMYRQDYITGAQYEEAVGRDLELSPSRREEATAVTSWYADMVIADVIRDLQETYGYTYAHASMLVYGGGLTIVTAMDESLQRTLEEFYACEGNFPVGRDGRPQSACILMDPATGDILAVAGAVGEKRGSRLQSYATDTRRPSGSCIKPLSVYALGLEQGRITWATLYADEPVDRKNGEPWPKNADGLYRGRITVGEALAHSVNTVSVQILTEIGTENSLQLLKGRLGMRSLRTAEESLHHDQTLSSLALGQQSYGVTLRELTGAYTALTDGVYRAPVSYHRVLDREGNLLLENPAADETAGRVFTEATAAVMTQMLRGVTETGTASRYLSEVAALGIQTAGKTGTTQNNCDRLFVGYTPRLLAGVWMGYDYPTELKGIEGNPCVTVWDRVMASCEIRYEGTPPKGEFDVPDSICEVEFCPLSGDLVGDYCQDPVYGHPSARGWFIRGSEPRHTCDLHTEPPIRWIPEDASDPDRIPRFDNDLVSDPRETTPPPPARDHWYSRIFSFFAKNREGSIGKGPRA